MASDEKMLEGIQMRLDAVPQGEWRSALGSGHNAMTAVVADIPDGDEVYETIFICDVIPDYRVEDPQVWENREPLLNFIQNAPTDIGFLQAALAASEAARRQAEERGRKLGSAIIGMVERLRLAEKVCHAVGSYAMANTQTVPYVEPRMLDAHAEWRAYVHRDPDAPSRPEPPAENDLLAIRIDRETLGRIVREAWVRCAERQPNPKPHHLLPWDALDETNKEIDREIGEAVATHLLGRPEPPADGLREVLAAMVREAVAAWGHYVDNYTDEPDNEETFDRSEAARMRLGKAMRALAAAPVAEGRGAGEGETQ